jgi:integrase
VRDINTDHVLKVLNPLWTTKTETASRLRSRIELILNYAATKGWRSELNPARWRGHLENLLPSPGRIKPINHMPAMRWPEIGNFMQVLRQRDGLAALALEFTILTAARTGETRLATWGEIDFEQKIWTIPAHRMKGKREHRVPLSDAALSVLKILPQGIGDELIFPGQRAGRPLSDMSLTAVLRRMNVQDATVHGFRSCFRDWAAETTAYPNHVVEMALAHTIGNAVEAAYRRGDLMEKRRALMADWSAHCDGRGTACIVPIRGAA